MNDVIDASTGLLPLVHSLPFEIMLRIFEFVLCSQPCLDREPISAGPTTKYPELLSHVCSYWRKVALSSPRLWSHIDLAPSRPPSKLARAEAFAARTGRIPLHVHIRFAGQTYCPEGVDYDLDVFCSSIAPRTGTLEMDHLNSDACVYTAIFIIFMLGCVPGNLEQLLISNSCSQSGFFPDMSALDIGIRTQLKALFLPVKVLSLSGFFFSWGHPLYHGLVELHLATKTGTGARNMLIDPWELQRVLSASPRLHTLVFGHGLSFSHLGPCGVPPMMFNDLEVLALCSHSWEGNEGTLRLIIPGPKPLRLFIELATIDYILLLAPDSWFLKFCEQANLVELSIKWKGDGASEDFFGLIMIEIVKAARGLRVLNLSNASLNILTPTRHHVLTKCVMRRTTTDIVPLPKDLYLDRLNLFHCDIDLAEHQSAVGLIPINTLGVDFTSCTYRGRPLDLNEATKLQAGTTEFFRQIVPVNSKGFTSEYWSPIKD